ncbi:hypothetical protein D3C84_1245120 [compost metagenome]
MKVRVFQLVSSRSGPVLALLPLHLAVRVRTPLPLTSTVTWNSAPRGTLLNKVMLAGEAWLKD